MRNSILNTFDLNLGILCKDLGIVESRNNGVSFMNPEVLEFYERIQEPYTIRIFENISIDIKNFKNLVQNFTQISLIILCKDLGIVESRNIGVLFMNPEVLESRNPIQLESFWISLEIRNIKNLVQHFTQISLIIFFQPYFFLLYIF